MRLRSSHDLPSGYDSRDAGSIRQLFDAIAPHYDLGNGVLSFQLYRLWNSFLIRKVLTSQQPDVFLDLCCGTGDISLAYLKKCRRPTTAYLLDFSAAMLSLCQRKAQQLALQPHHLVYLQADALQVPLPSASVDAIVIAYGIRNLGDSIQCLRESRRLLRPGGSLGILELTRPSNALLQWGHRQYLARVIPWMAVRFSSHSCAYDYLSQSILAFMPPSQLQKLMETAGFTSVASQPLCGGIATAWWGTQP